MITRMRTMAGTAVALGLAGVLAVPGTALADNVQNNIEVGGADTITAGGSTTVGYRISATGVGNDGQAGCNASDGSAATVTINAPAGVTASTGSLVFDSCGTYQDVIFGAATAGSYPITVSVTDSGTKNMPAGTYTVNQAAFTLTVKPKPDTTPPVITPTVTGTVGDDGWYTSDASLTWAVTDAESDVTGSSGCGPVAVTADQGATAYTCSATSTGGTSSRTVSIKRDATAPTVAVTGVADGAVYAAGSEPAADCETTDATSGVAAAATATRSGGAVGPVTVTCAGAKDAAGNAAAAVSASYAVRYTSSNLLRPIDLGGVFNTVKAGSAVPVKFSLSGDQGMTVLAANPVTRAVTCSTSAPTDAVEELAATNTSGLSYDPVGDVYTYVWKTDKATAGTCRQLTVALADGQTHTALFKLLK